MKKSLPVLLFVACLTLLGATGVAAETEPAETPTLQAELMALELAWTPTGLMSKAEEDRLALTLMGFPNCDLFPYCPCNCIADCQWAFDACWASCGGNPMCQNSCMMENSCCVDICCGEYPQMCT